MALETNNSSTGDFQNVARKLDALDVQLSDAIGAARKRNIATMVISVASALVIGAWLIYAHMRFSNEVTPGLAATLLQGYIEQNLPQATAQLENSLKQNAPAMINEGEKQLRGMPVRLQTQFHDEASKALDAEMPQLQARLSTTLKEGLAEARAAGKDVSNDKDDEARFRALATSLATLYGTESMKAVDDVNSQYTKASGDIVNGLNLLAEGKNLTPEQKTQRNLVRDFLILAKDSSGGKGITLPTAK